MNHYELVLMVHPDQSEQVSTIVGRYVEMIKTNGGSIDRQEDWGRKSLSYPINKLHKAHYMLLNIQLAVEHLKELTDALRYNDFILRYFVLKVKGVESEPSLMMQPRKAYNEGDK